MLITLNQNQFLEEDGEIIFLCCTVSVSAVLTVKLNSVSTLNSVNVVQREIRRMLLCIRCLH